MSLHTLLGDLAARLTLIGVMLVSPCGIIAALSTVAAGKAAAEPAAPAQKVNMACVDAQGKAVAGAEMYLFQYSGAAERYVQSGPFTSDVRGKAVCGEALFSNDLGNFDRWIYARVPGRLVGVSRSAKWTNQKVINPEFQVEMHESGSVKGQVTVPDGFDCTKVVVRVRTLHIRTGAGLFQYQSFPREDHFPGLDTALPKIFDCRPDSTGQIRFDDVPVQGMLYLVTAGDGLGEAQWRNDAGPPGQAIPLTDQEIELTIPRESSLAGRVLTPKGAPAAGMKIAARLSPARSRPVFYLSTFRAVTNEKGEFTIRGLPQTEFVLSIEDPTHRSTFRPLENFLVQPDEEQSLELEMETGVLVSGRVFDPEGKPVAAASFSAVADSQNGPGLAHDMTDANGRYQFRIPSGKARLYFDSLPEGFAYPNPQIVANLDVASGQDDIKDLDFTLERQPEEPERGAPCTAGSDK